MKQLAAEKLLWAIIDDCGWLVAITAGDTAAEGLKMYVGDQSRKDLVAGCDDGCAGRPTFKKNGTQFYLRLSRKGPGCGTGCSCEYRVEPLTSAFLEGGPSFDGSLLFFLTHSGSGPTFYPAMSDEEYNVLVAKNALWEAQHAVEEAEKVPVSS